MYFRIEQQYQNVLTLWHETHINMKSVVSWHYLINEIDKIRASNVASVSVNLHINLICPKNVGHFVMKSRVCICCTIGWSPAEPVLVHSFNAISVIYLLFTGHFLRIGVIWRSHIPLSAYILIGRQDIVFGLLEMSPV